MIDFICPVCRLPLKDRGVLYCCGNNHSFDKSKFGYVNLLQSNQSSLKRHGDDRVMIRARRDFLSKGYYSFLADEIVSVCEEFLKKDSVLIDAGCGECYYSSIISDRFPEYCLSGVDISKDALEYAHKRGIKFPLCVASLFSLPYADDTADCILNCFSPKADSEYYRVLKTGGILIRVVPLEMHLFTLKEYVYDKPYANEKPPLEAEGFETVKFIETTKNIEIDNREDILNLFKMTPYYYKTGREDQNKIEYVDKFTTSAEFGIIVLRKKSESNA